MSEALKCRSCGAPVVFQKTLTGKSIPMNYDEQTGLVGTTHFTDCPQANDWRRIGREPKEKV